MCAGFISPVVLHFVIGQLLAFLSLWLMSSQPDVETAYTSQVILVTGLTGLLTGGILCFSYRRDQLRRKSSNLPVRCPRFFLSFRKILLLLIMGAGFGQYMNILMGMIAEYLPSGDYFEEMAAITNGKSLAFMIFWTGIIAPFAEEMVFRVCIFLRLRDHLKLLPSAILSAAFFGIYHGNFVQGIYAGVLGFLFALIMEWSGCLSSSFFLHAGANIWMLVLDEYMYRFLLPPGDRFYVLFSFIMILCMIIGLRMFRRDYRP